MVKVAGFADRRPVAVKLKEELATAWAHLSPSDAISDAMADFVATAPDCLVGRMRPYALARQYGLPPRETLMFCLRAVKAGYLDLSWDVICPSCRSAQLRAPTLSAVESTVHCHACEIDYRPELSRNVEVSFRPVERIRPLEDVMYNLQSPSHQRHIWAQLNIEPQSVVEVSVAPAPGRYLLRHPGIEGEIMIEVKTGSRNRRVRVRVDQPLPPGELICGTEFDLVLENKGPRWRTIRLERLPFWEDAATAVEVTALQEFRDQFSDEVLRPGVQIGVSNIVLLFSDLKNSTTLYELI